MNVNDCEWSEPATKSYVEYCLFLPFLWLHLQYDTICKHVDTM